MDLKSFEIYNFRAIDNVKCVLSPAITVLAGKNEAGKTSVLETLEALNSDWKFEEMDRPQDQMDEKDFVLKYIFELSNEDKENICNEIDGIDEIKNGELIIERHYPDATYIIYGKAEDEISSKTSELLDISTILDGLNTLNQEFKNDGIPLPIPNVDELEATSQSLNEIKPKLNVLIQQITQSYPALLGKFNPLITVALNEIDKQLGINSHITEILEKIKKHVPKIVLFSSFNDILPSDVPFAEFVNSDTLRANKHRIVDDLASLSDINREKLQGADAHAKAILAMKASTLTSEKFGKHWNQDPIEISFQVNEPNILFFIGIKVKIVHLGQSKEVRVYVGIFHFS